MAEKIPSKYQKRFYEELVETDNNIIVAAKAGSGKTTTIVNSLKLLPKDKHIIFLAFNKNIVEELRTRVSKNISVNTLHSFGSRMLYMHYGSLKFNENKAFITALKMYDGFNTEDDKYSYCYRVGKLVDIMRMTMVFTGIDDIMELAFKYGLEVFNNEIESALKVLEASNKASTDSIDYTDMIFQPAVRNIKLKKFDYVFVDEVQDLNKAQQTIVKKIVHPVGGRLIAVGDPDQSIFGFAGADLDSFNNMIKLLPNTVELPLSVCYRCPKELIKYVQLNTKVKDIEYFEGSIQGEEPRMGSYKEIRAGDWVLCRNTKPLVLLFIELINENKKAFIKGREIGKNLINLINKTKAKTIPDLVAKLKQDKVELKIKLIKKRVYRPDQSQKMVQFDEKFRVIEILSKTVTSVKLLIKKIEGIFLDEDVDAIVLSTIHRVKGGETDNVFVLAKELMPSPYAKSEEDFVQEENLRYVCYTRAKKKLIFINDFDLDKNK